MVNIHESEPYHTQPAKLIVDQSAQPKMTSTLKPNSLFNIGKKSKDQPPQQQPQPIQPQEAPIENTNTKKGFSLFGRFTNKNKSSSTNTLQSSNVATSKSSSNKLNKSNTNLTSVSQKASASSSSASKNKYRVVYLDETDYVFELDKAALGSELLNAACDYLNLIEREFFSLTFRDANNMKFWLDHDKKLKSQLKNLVLSSASITVFNFEVKFYPPEPKLLVEDFTRYLLTLQLRHDIMNGKLPCSFVTYALLGSYTAQSELGDFDPQIHGEEYLDGFYFAPQQDIQLLDKIAFHHREHKGQTPEEAEMHYLENAVKLPMYGVDLHNCKDSDGIDILLGVSASGLMVYRERLRINRFSWPKILKISFKRNYFYLKLRAGMQERYDSTIGFRCPNHKAAKRLWKIAVEHHAFFRLREPEMQKKSKLMPNLNASHRMSVSSTYMQTRNRSVDRQQPSFTRSLSKRLSQSMDRGFNSGPNTPASTSFNRPHTSTHSIPNQIKLRESDEDADEDEYMVDERTNPNNNNAIANNPLLPRGYKVVDASNLRPNQHAGDYSPTGIRTPSNTSNYKPRAIQSNEGLPSPLLDTSYNKASTPIINKDGRGLPPPLPQVAPRYVPPSSIGGQKSASEMQQPSTPTQNLSSRTNTSNAQSPIASSRISAINKALIPNNEQRGFDGLPVINNSYRDTEENGLPQLYDQSGAFNNNSQRRPVINYPQSPRDQKDYEARQIEAEEEARRERERLAEEQRRYYEFQVKQEEVRRLKEQQRQEELRRIQLEKEREEQERLRYEQEQETQRRYQDDIIRHQKENEAAELRRRQEELELGAKRLRDEQEATELRRYQEMEARRVKQEQEKAEQLRLQQIAARQRQQQQQQQEISTSKVTPLTPNSSRVERTMVISSSTSHKEALLNAIRIATELDPNLEVEKVEITSEE